MSIKWFHLQYYKAWTVNIWIPFRAEIVSKNLRTVSCNVYHLSVLASMHTHCVTHPVSHMPVHPPSHHTLLQRESPSLVMRVYVQMYHWIHVTTSPREVTKLQTLLCSVATSLLDHKWLNTVYSPWWMLHNVHKHTLSLYTMHYMLYSIQAT